jgi:predicted nicotinamide N-methyase
MGVLLEERIRQFSVNKIEENLKSRRDLALYRIQLLEEKEKKEEEGDGDDHNDGDHGGFSSFFVPVLRESVSNFVSLLATTTTTKKNHNHPNDKIMLSDAIETRNILRLLTIYRRISGLDPTLDEEIGMDGSHICLSTLMKIDINSIIDDNNDNDDNNEIINEANQDTIIEIQDLAGEIASFSKKSFPLRSSSLLMRTDLIARLPLVFTICPVVPQYRKEEEDDDDDDGKITILINQVTSRRQSAQKDVGFVMWPSAVVLARWIVSNPNEFRGKRILELGSGCGLAGLVAGKIVHHDYCKDNKHDDNNNNNKETTGLKSGIENSGCVILSDFNETVVKNIEGNLELNNLNEIGTAEGLDFYQQDTKGDGWMTIDGVKRTDLFDIIIASDVICQPEDAFAAARSIAATLKEGGKAIMVSADSKHRFGVEKFEEACSIVGSLTITSKINVDDYFSISSTAAVAVDDDDDDMEKTSGFVQGMSLTMYTIIKTREI